MTYYCQGRHSGNGYQKYNLSKGIQYIDFDCGLKKEQLKHWVNSFPNEILYGEAFETLEEFPSTLLNEFLKEA